MHGDFSRLTFRARKRYRAVLTQQGRIQLDADANEQVEIDDHLLRTLVTDLVGPYAGPVGRPQDDGTAGFGITYESGVEPADLRIGPGRYYVGGMLCDGTPPTSPTAVDDEGHAMQPGAAEDYRYWSQPDFFPDPQQDADALPAPPFLVYLQVSERLVTAVEDDDLLDPALGALRPDTTARLKVTWQVRALLGSELGDISGDANAEEVRGRFDGWLAGQPATGLLAARTMPSADTGPCVLAPDSAYRGPENQLYRVEIHRGGPAGGEGSGTDLATFVWSRENGSVVFAVTDVAGDLVTLAATGRDTVLDLEVGDWVEPLDDVAAASGRTVPLLQVLQVEAAERRVRLSAEPGLARPAQGRHPRLRRWDQRGVRTGSASGLIDGAQELVEGRWLDLEDGIQVCFVGPATYRTGQYWVIPARTCGGSVLWPQNESGRALAEPPRGPEVARAPLAWIRGDGTLVDLRTAFRSSGLPIEQALG